MSLGERLHDLFTREAGEPAGSDDQYLRRIVEDPGEMVEGQLAQSFRPPRALQFALMKVQAALVATFTD